MIPIRTTAMLDPERTRAFVQAAWDAEVVPALVEYVRVPAKSPQ